MKLKVLGPDTERFNLTIDSVVAPGDVVIVQTVLLITDVVEGEAMAVLAGMNINGIKTSMLFPDAQEPVA